MLQSSFEKGMMLCLRQPWASSHVGYWIPPQTAQQSISTSPNAFPGKWDRFHTLPPFPSVTNVTDIFWPLLIVISMWRKVPGGKDTFLPTSATSQPALSFSTHSYPCLHPELLSSRGSEHQAVPLTHEAQQSMDLLIQQHLLSLVQTPTWSRVLLKELSSSWPRSQWVF